MAHRMVSIIVSHFILDLKSIYYTPGETSQSHRSTIHFASAVEGNLGAPLSHSWLSGADEVDDCIEEGPHYSEYPFSTGLFEEGHVCAVGGGGITR